MKTIRPLLCNSFLNLGLLLLAAGFSGLPAARAGLAFTVDLYVSNGSYVFYTPVNTNGVGAAAPYGAYNIYSPGWPANGSWRQFSYDTNGFNTTSGGENNYTNLAAALEQITNGLWTITLTNATTTNTYQFTVSLPGGLASNQLPVTVITAPANNASGVTNLPTFTWTGQPADWPVSGSAYVTQYGNNGSFYCPGSVAAAQTSWTIPVAIPASNPGNYTYFILDYATNYTANLFVASTPTNIVNGQTIAGWAYNSTLESGGQINLTVTPPPAASSGHTLVAHYTFDNSGDPGFDSSPNGNSFECDSSWGANIFPAFTNDAVAGGGAVEFFGDSSITGCGGPEFTSWTNTLLGSFTVSAWIKTTTVAGNDNDPLNDGDGQNVIYLNNNGNGVIPLGITGTQAAIATGVSPGAYGQDTLNSVGTVTSGNYVHVVVTRDAGSGLKQIYLNGVLDSSDYAEPGILDGGADYASIGGELSGPYTGELDDVQIYQGVLSSSEVAYLFTNPGLIVANGSVNGLLAHYTFDDPDNLGMDSTSNHFDMDYISSFGSPDDLGSISATNDAVAGGGAVAFARNPNDPEGSSNGGIMGWQTTPPDLLNALAGDFSISLWVQTSDINGNSYPGDFGSMEGLVSADVPGVANDLIPVALSGGAPAFNVGNTDTENDDTLFSPTSINDGNWHHIVVMRHQATGERDIYIDGVLDSSDVDTTNLLNDPQMLTLGALADASQSNPTNGAYYNGYAGLLDDLQIYARTLSSNEVAFLYANPGLTLGSGTPNNVSLSFQMNIVRNQDPVAGDVYYCFPSFSAESPTPITVDEVQSPNNLCSGQLYSSSSADFSSLDSLLNECTNGQWTIYVNQGDPSQQQFTFNVSIAGLDTNLLQAVNILSPPNGGTNLDSLPSYSWSGPADFSGIFAQVTYTNSQVGYANLPGTATDWSFPTSLNLGTNQFYVNYFTNNAANVTFTTPMDANSTPLFSWNAQANLNSEATANFVVTPTIPVLLAGPTVTGNSFRFQFLSQNGRNNQIQARTNLTTGEWVTVTNYAGDGTLKSVILTNSIFGASQQGFLRVSSQ